jgi:hypothetical protein
VSLQTRGPYGDPLVYDILNAPGTREAVDGLVRIAGRCGADGPDAHWLEPACGSGRFLRETTRRGIRITGFDIQPAMIGYAKRRLRRLGRSRWRVFVADLEGFSPGIEPRSVDFAFDLDNTVRHLLDDAAMRTHLDDMARVLRPGALYAVGVDLARYGEDLPWEDVWEASRGGIAVSQVVQYLPPTWSSRQETVIEHLVIQRPGRVEHRDHVYRLRTYDPDQWERLIAACGFQIVDVVDEAGHGTRERPFAYGIHLLRHRG